jgi:hypothetical protein
LGCTFIQKEPRAQTVAADKLAQNLLGERQALSGTTRGVDAEKA